ncbi:MAG TPA: helix-turn-helix transcriptional regulator [Acidimicrobiales bacterium]|nr:helix-turn-helix transcriptional regulator [Acidimicrobiales bacterium]
MEQARKRARLTQSDVARRAGVTTSVLSRWERGWVEPSFEAVDRVVEACGLRLSAVLSEAPIDPHDAILVTEALARTPSERLQLLMDYVRFVESARSSAR